MRDNLKERNPIQCLASQHFPQLPCNGLTILSFFIDKIRDIDSITMKTDIPTRLAPLRPLLETADFPADSGENSAAYAFPAEFA